MIIYHHNKIIKQGKNEKELKILNLVFLGEIKF